MLWLSVSLIIIIEHGCRLWLRFVYAVFQASAHLHHTTHKQSQTLVTVDRPLVEHTTTKVSTLLKREFDNLGVPIWRLYYSMCFPVVFCRYWEDCIYHALSLWQTVFHDFVIRYLIVSFCIILSSRIIMTTVFYIHSHCISCCIHSVWAHIQKHPFLLSNCRCVIFLASSCFLICLYSTLLSLPQTGEVLVCDKLTAHH